MTKSLARTFVIGRACFEALEGRQLMSASLLMHYDVGGGADDISKLSQLNGTTSVFLTTSPGEADANTGEQGISLWATNGTKKGTKDLYDGISGVGWAGTGTVVGDKAYFVIDRATAFSELWVTDGSAAGTRKVAVGVQWDGKTELPSLNGKVYFPTSDGLYKTDGTVQGTALVQSFPGEDLSHMTSVVAGGALYFTSGGGDPAVAGARRLWRTDGSSLEMVSTLNGSADAIVNVPMAAVGQKVYFVDGTPSGSALFSVNPNAQPVQVIGGLNRAADGMGLGQSELVAAGTSGVYFTAGNGTNYSLYFSNGTSIGTSIVVSDVYAPDPNADWDELTAPPISGLQAIGNGSVMFQRATGPGAIAGTLDYQEWVSDGTVGHTYIVSLAGNIITDRPFATTADGFAYFAETSGSHVQLWKTDGVSSRTLLVDANLGYDNAGADGATFDSASAWFSDAGTIWRFGPAMGSAPIATAGGAYAINYAAGVSLDASGSSDADDDALTYAWDLNNDGVFGDATGAKPSLSWNQLKAFGFNGGTSGTVKVRVTDEQGLSTVGSTTLTVGQGPIIPPPDEHVLTAGLEGEDLGDDTPGLYRLTLHVTDPGTATPTSWMVTWGDGSVLTYPITQTTVFHTYEADGAYAISASITDGNGAHDTGDSLTANVALPQPPPPTGDQGGISISQMVLTNFPKTIVGGSKTAKGIASVKLVNTAQDKVAGRFTVGVYATLDGTVGDGAVLIGTMTVALNLKTGQGTKVMTIRLTAPAVSSDTAYTVVAKVMGTGAAVDDTLAADSLLTVVRPVTDLTVAQGKIKTLLRGRRGVVGMVLSNEGNTDARSAIRLSVSAVVNGQEVEIGALSRTIAVLAGRSVNINVSSLIPKDWAAGTYTLVLRVTGSADQVAGNNTATAQVTVA